jgi:hypothetical protein
MSRTTQITTGLVLRQAAGGPNEFALPEGSILPKHLSDSVKFGLLPLGAVVPVMTHIAGAISAPASGVVEEGLMLCDGASIPAGQTLSGTLPNLTGIRFLAGATTSGTTGGNAGNNVTLLETNLPAHVHSIAHTHDMSHTHAIDHTHGSSAVSGTVGGSDGLHTHGYTDPGHAHPTVDGRYISGDSATGEDFAPVMASGTGGGSATVANAVGSNTVGITINNTGSGHSHSHSLTAAGQTFTGSSGAASTSNTGASSAPDSGSTGSGTAFSIAPQYVTAVYLIRVS